MNERIKLLADEAAKFSARLALPTGESGDKLFVEKFAELIVRECMNAVCDPSTTHLESMTDASAMYTARERIRKRFRS